MREANVLYKEVLAGIIAETEDGYSFQYNEQYLKNADAKPVSLTLPIQQEPYMSNILFPFFDGLIPEGWLLEIATNTWKLNQRDRFGLLLALCKDCIGCVSVQPIEKEV